MSSRYLLISPSRNEARFLPATIASVAGQSVLPARWVIVDDGSKDSTPEILRDAAARYPFIEVVGREDRGKRSVGPGVIDAFYAGLERVHLDDYDFVGKLDVDLELPERYFERVIARFEAEPRLGNFSGKAYLRDPHGSLRPERMGDENAIGAVKFYRVACFRDIGGFVREVCWDGIDGHLCRMKGWIARSVDEPELRVVHLRPMGSSQGGLWKGRRRWGGGKWFMGSAWYYVLAVSLYRMAEPPYVIGGVGILVGYLEAAIRGSKRFDDSNFRRYLRRYELRSLLLGRRRTAEAYHRRCGALDPGRP